MRINMRATFAMLLIVAAVSLAPAAAQTPSTPARDLAPHPTPELALTYT